jgi:nicotinamide-nucleotide amidase
MKVEEDHGRDINLAIATNTAMRMFHQYLMSEETQDETTIEEAEIVQ